VIGARRDHTAAFPHLAPPRAGAGWRTSSRRGRFPRWSGAGLIWRKPPARAAA